MKFRVIGRADLAKSQIEFESACHCSRAYNAKFSEYLAQFGDIGPDVSGAGRAHFPDEAKDHLRRIAKAVAHHCANASLARPSRVHRSTIIRLGQEIATRDGVGFYGPAALFEGKATKC